jgi:hypothetical protein
MLESPESMQGKYEQCPKCRKLIQVLPSDPLAELVKVEAASPSKPQIKNTALKKKIQRGPNAFSIAAMIMIMAVTVLGFAPWISLQWITGKANFSPATNIRIAFLAIKTSATTVEPQPQVAAINAAPTRGYKNPAVQEIRYVTREKTDAEVERELGVQIVHKKSTGILDNINPFQKKSTSKKQPHTNTSPQVTQIRATNYEISPVVGPAKPVIVKPVVRSSLKPAGSIVFALYPFVYFLGVAVCVVGAIVALQSWRCGTLLAGYVIALVACMMFYIGMPDINTQSGGVTYWAFLVLVLCLLGSVFSGVTFAKK